MSWEIGPGSFMPSTEGETGSFGLKTGHSADIDFSRPIVSIYIKILPNPFEKMRLGAL